MMSTAFNRGYDLSMTRAFDFTGTERYAQMEGDADVYGSDTICERVRCDKNGRTLRQNRKRPSKILRSPRVNIMLKQSETLNILPIA